MVLALGPRRTVAFVRLFHNDRQTTSQTSTATSTDHTPTSKATSSAKPPPWRRRKRPPSQRGHVKPDPDRF